MFYKPIKGKEKAGRLSPYNSIRRSFNFNREFLFRIKMFCNERRDYSSKIKNGFCVSHPYPSYPDYLIQLHFLTPIKYKFKSKSSRIMKKREGGREGGRGGRQRKENTHTHGTVTKNNLLNNLLCQDFVCFWFVFLNKQNTPTDLPEEHEIT